MYDVITAKQIKEQNGLNIFFNNCILCFLRVTTKCF